MYNMYIMQWCTISNVKLFFIMHMFFCHYNILGEGDLSDLVYPCPFHLLKDLLHGDIFENLHVHAFIWIILKLYDN